MIRIPTRCFFAWLLVAAALAFAVGGCTVTAPPAQKPATHQFGVQTKTSGCLARGAMPDPACTPGALMPGVTKSRICRSGYASSVRNVPQSQKNRVYAEYGVATHFPGQYEVDHLVSLQLGGSNDTANLWPEAASPTPGFHEKDRVENYLRDQVCKGKISLQQAQVEIATNWLQVYRQMPRGTKSAFAAVAEAWCSDRRQSVPSSSIIAANDGAQRRTALRAASGDQLVEGVKRGGYASGSVRWA